jgi:ABC-type transport system involved in multi-copper enzyme maturation permease subunit
MILSILATFSIYWMPYANFINIIKQLTYIAKTKSVPLETLLSSESSLINDTMQIYISSNVVNYVGTLFCALLMMLAPFLVSYSIGNEYSLKTIRVTVSHASRSRIFLSKYISNLIVLVAILLVSVTSGVIFSNILKPKINGALKAYIPAFQIKNVSFDFVSHIPIQLVFLLFLICAVISIIYLLNILTKSAFVGSIISFVWLYFEGGFLSAIHLESASLSINMFSITSKIFFYFEGGSVQNLVSKQVYKSQDLIVATLVILVYVIIPALISYFLFKREDL